MKRNNIRIAIEGLTVAISTIFMVLCTVNESRDIVLERDSAVASVEPVAQLDSPWGIDKVPIEGVEQLLITEKRLKTVVVVQGDRARKSIPIKITGRQIITKDNSESVHPGLHDIVFDPEYNNTTNKYIYLSVILRQLGSEDCLDHAIIKVSYDYEKRIIVDAPITQNNIIFDTVRDGLCVSYHSPGGRMLFLPDKTLLFSIGDRGYYMSPHIRTFGGKIVRIDRAGNAVCDIDGVESNPFCDAEEEVSRYIYTLGHKNIQGIAVDTTGNIYASEHGARRGDEINRLNASYNYGYPFLCIACIPYSSTAPYPVTYADYQQSPDILHEYITVSNTYPSFAHIVDPATYLAGLTPPLFTWTHRTDDASIAPSGIAFYQYDGEYRNSLLVATLNNRALERLSINSDGTLTRATPMLQGMRFRDVLVTGKDEIYVLSIGRVSQIDPAVDVRMYILEKFSGEFIPRGTNAGGVWKVSL